MRLTQRERRHITHGALGVVGAALIALGFFGGIVLAVQHDLWARLGLTSTHGFFFSAAIGLSVALAGVALLKVLSALSEKEGTKSESEEEMKRRRNEERRNEPSAKIAAFDGAILAGIFLVFISPMMLIIPFGKVDPDGESRLDWEALSAAWELSLASKAFVVLVALLPPLLGFITAVQMAAEDGKALKELPKRTLDALLRRRDSDQREESRDDVSHPLRWIWWTPREKAYLKGFFIRGAGFLLMLSGVLGMLGLLGGAGSAHADATELSQLRLFLSILIVGGLLGAWLFWWGGKFEFGFRVDSERATELRKAAAESSPSAKIAIAESAVIALILSFFVSLIFVSLSFPGAPNASGERAPDAALMLATWSGSWGGKLWVSSVLFGPYLAAFALLILFGKSPDVVAFRTTPKRLREARRERRRVAEKMIRQEGQVTIADSLAERGDLSEPEQTR